MCHSEGKSIDGVCRHKGCVWWGVVDGRGEEGGVGNRSKTQEQNGGEEPLGKERRALEEVGGVENYCRGEEKWALNLPSQSDRNHSLQQYPAETFDMEIHDCVNIWTQCRSNSYIIGNSPVACLAAAFILSDSTYFVSVCLVWKSQAVLNISSCFATDIASALELIAPKLGCLNVIVFILWTHHPSSVLSCRLRAQTLQLACFKECISKFGSSVGNQ